MFDLTKQERLVLIFLVSVFLVGTTLHYTFEKNSHLNHIFNIIDSDGLYRKIDINLATYEELVNLPYIGPVTAKRIMGYRSQKGSFTNIEQLKAVQGIGNFNYQKIAKFLKVEKSSL